MLKYRRSTEILEPIFRYSEQTKVPVSLNLLGRLQPEFIFEDRRILLDMKGVLACGWKEIPEVIDNLTENEEYFIYPGDFRYWNEDGIENLAGDPRVAVVFCDLLPDEFPDHAWKRVSTTLGKKLRMLPFIGSRVARLPSANSKQFFVICDSGDSKSGNSYFSASYDSPRRIALKGMIDDFEKSTGVKISLLDSQCVSQFNVETLRDLSKATMVWLLNCHPAIVSMVLAITKRVIIGSDQWKNSARLRSSVIDDLEVPESNYFREASSIRKILKDFHTLVTSAKNTEQVIDRTTEFDRIDLLIGRETSSSDSDSDDFGIIQIDMSEAIQDCEGIKWVPTEYRSFLLMLKEILTSEPSGISRLEEFSKKQLAGFINEEASPNWIRAYEWASLNIPSFLQDSCKKAELGQANAKSIAYGIFRGMLWEFAHDWREKYVKRAISILESVDLDPEDMGWLASMYFGIGDLDKGKSLITGDPNLVPSLRGLFYSLFCSKLTYVDRGVVAESEQIRLDLFFDAVNRVRREELNPNIYRIIAVCCLYRGDIKSAVHFVNLSQNEFGVFQADYCSLAIHSWLAGNTEVAAELLSREKLDGQNWSLSQQNFLGSAHAIFGDEELGAKLFAGMDKVKENFFSQFYCPSILWGLLYAALRALGQEELAFKFEAPARELHPLGDLLIRRCRNVSVRINKHVPKFKPPCVLQSYSRDPFQTKRKEIGK